MPCHDRWLHISDKQAYYVWGIHEFIRHQSGYETLVTGSRTFHNKNEAIEFAQWSLWLWLRPRKQDPVNMEIIQLRITLWRWIAKWIHVWYKMGGQTSSMHCLTNSIIINYCKPLTSATFTIPCVFHCLARTPMIVCRCNLLLGQLFWMNLHCMRC